MKTLNIGLPTIGGTKKKKRKRERVALWFAFRYCELAQDRHKKIIESHLLK